METLNLLQHDHPEYRIRLPTLVSLSLLILLKNAISFLDLAPTFPEELFGTPETHRCYFVTLVSLDFCSSRLACLRETREKRFTDQHYIATLCVVTSPLCQLTFLLGVEYGKTKHKNEVQNTSSSLM